MQQRPKEFDAQLVAYLPGLRNHAKRFVAREDVDELVQDTVAYALQRWTLYRDAEGTFATWLQWQMRAVIANRKEKAGTKKRKHKDVPIDGLRLTTPARQEDIVYAGQIVRRLSRSRDGRMLVRLGKGEKLREIGERRGITHERVRQLTERARENLVARIAA
jgi:RNA polymerase sigma factor (sigma-70 family)